VPKHPEYGSNHIDPGDPGIPPYANPDPINAWNPGPVEEQRAHFRPVPGDHRHVEYGATTDEMLPKAKPVREGPDYAGDDETVNNPFVINISYPADSIPDRTKWILQNPLPTAIRAFIRHNLQYGDADKALGLQGQFVEIHHITTKLRRLIWNRRAVVVPDENDARRELENLIGHALLALDLLNEGNNDGRN
jgi:hypothetical protein